MVNIFLGYTDMITYATIWKKLAVRTIRRTGDSSSGGDPLQGCKRRTETQEPRGTFR